MNALHVVEPGALCLVQDLGRLRRGEAPPEVALPEQRE